MSVTHVSPPTLRGQSPHIMDCYWAPCGYQCLSQMSRADGSADGHAMIEMKGWGGDMECDHGDGDSAH